MDNSKNPWDDDICKGYIALCMITPLGYKKDCDEWNDFARSHNNLLEEKITKYCNTNFDHLKNYNIIDNKPITKIDYINNLMKIKESLINNDIMEL